MTLIQKINKLGEQRIPFFLLVDFLCLRPVLFRIDELAMSDIDIEFPTFRTYPSERKNQQIQLKKSLIPFDDYERKFNLIKGQLQYGNSFLTNLTCETPIETNATLEEIFHTAAAKYKIKYKDEWVCFSPETFIKIKDCCISAYPMKGTIDASLPNAETTLLHDEKELAEHFTIVDLLRNDLSIIASDVKVKKFRYVDSIQSADKKLYQTSSIIEAMLPTNFHSHLGDILFSLLPAGSVSGAPKKKTLEIIQSVENYDRGFYTGTAFYFDGDQIDSCVLIRFIENTEKGFVYKSGGGITVHSEVKKEYNELIDKIYVPGI